MNLYQVQVHKAIEKDLLTKPTNLRQVRKIFRPPCRIVDAESGETLIICGKLPKRHDEIKAFLPNIKYQGNSRLALSDNLKNLNLPKRSVDVSFGYRPTRPVFNIAAGPCAFNQHYPRGYQLLLELGLELAAIYEETNLAKYTWQKHLMEELSDDWKLPGGLFTQGIINKSNPLPFHYDRGNFEGVWSCMATFARDVSGGQLVVPAIDGAVAVEDECYFLFDGQNLLHGVAPIQNLSANAGRFSIVYYAQKIMLKATTIIDERNKQNQRETEKLLRRAERHRK